MNISVVIPAYNEALNIRSIIAELLSTFEKIPEIRKVQMLIIDDHSSDGTYDTVKALNDPHVTCIRLSRRSGSHTALRVGIKEATGDAVLCMSADGQDDPSCVNGMIGKWRGGGAVVWALRKDRVGEAWHLRQFAKLFYNSLLWLARAECQGIDFSRADFFLLDRKVVDAVNSCPERNTSLFGLIGWVGFRQDFVEYERQPRKIGTSKWNFRSRFHLAKDWIVAFSGLPLFLMYVLGLIIMIIGFLYGVIAVVSGSVSGFAGIVAALMVLCGIQMIGLGILGEYVWRGLDESRKRPLFFIENRSDKPSKG